MIRAMDDVFRALADPTRRGLLDELFRQDGQSLSTLEQRLPMTRFGVMKHLRVLEQAGLVTTRRRGREKLHFLNPVPIRLVHDRWVSKYAEPWVAGLSGLKRQTGGQDNGEGIRDLHQDHPRAPLGGDHRRRDARAATASAWASAPIGQRGPRMRPRIRVSPTPISAGENLEVDPPRRLVQSFNALWSDEVEAEGTSRVTWEIEPIGDSCRLTVTHDQLRDEANSELYGGWPMILSGLKTLLETGEALTTPGSLRYAAAAPAG